MTKQKHTPGRTPEQEAIYHEWVAARDEYDRRERVRNAAPQMLEALKMAQLWLDIDGRYDMRAINAAIAAAEGGE